MEVSEAVDFAFDSVQAWDHHWLDDDEAMLSLSRRGNGYLLRFPQLADFLVEPDASRITFARLSAAADDATLEHLLIDQVLPRYFAHDGLLSLHASAITVGDKCLLILGESGAGKSTLAGFLGAHGHGLLSDDCTMVELHEGRVVATPTYPSLRLLPDSLEALYPAGVHLRPMASYSSKQRVVSPNNDGGMPTLPVHGLLVIAASDPACSAVTLAAMPAAEACMALVRHSFQLDPGDKPRMGTHIRVCSQIARQLGACILSYPRSYAQMHEVVAAIEAHALTLPTPLDRTRPPKPGS